MPAKAKMPMPIDRPLSRAYLRKFGGWSSAYPPGLSDPASLRVMENVMVNRDGSLRVRPGLRNLTVEEGTSDPLGGQQFIRGSHEAFYLNDGRKAYLFAVYQEATNNVQFRVAYEPDKNSTERKVVSLAAAGFTGATPSFSAGTTYVKYVQIDNKILALSNNGEPLIVFYVGATKKVPSFSVIADPPWVYGASRGFIDMPSLNWVLSSKTTQPTHAVDFSSTTGIAQGFTSTANPYNYAFCYTFSNDLGETAPSEIAQFKAQRPWGGWLWNSPDTTLMGTQTMTPHPTNVTSDPAGASDQLSLILPDYGLIEGAAAAGGTKINFYVMSWSNQDSVPVEMQLVGSRDLVPGATWASHGWFMLTPATLGLGPTIPIPTAENRWTTNTTEPPRAAQGIVAADRLVLVNDPTKAAVIRWSTTRSGTTSTWRTRAAAGTRR